MLYYDEIGSRPLHSEQKMGKLCDKCQQFHSKKKIQKKFLSLALRRELYIYRRIGKKPTERIF